jgi:hypothetical protein
MLLCTTCAIKSELSSYIQATQVQAERVCGWIIRNFCLVYLLYLNLYHAFEMHSSGQIKLVYLWYSGHDYN